MRDMWVPAAKLMIAQAADLTQAPAFEHEGKRLAQQLARSFSRDVSP